MHERTALIRKRLIVSAALTEFVTACSGGGGGGTNQAAANPPAGPPPGATANSSPGGIWHGVSTNNETLSLFVDETGDLRSLETEGVPPTAPPLFGSGAVLVSGGNRLDGAYDSGRPFSTLAEHCEFMGTLTERISMSISLECTDESGTKRSSAVILGYDSDYGGGSSLATIAGNYAFAAKPSNFLNIDGNGVVFGVYDNGPNCTVNGVAEVIDARYNFYRLEWHLSLCQTLTKFEGATLTGFGFKNVRGTPAGSLFALLTGIVDGHVEGASLLFGG
jgi:hypothetical protein